MSSKPIHSNHDYVIEVRGVKKCYHSYKKPIHRLWQSFHQTKRYYDEFWALKGVDLSVAKGETVGIVGKNGSGKSTLLQIITGILQASEGQVTTRGRVSALLELGAGFSPEFTGMENARLNASIMGLTRQEFHEKLPDIVDFCGLGDFLHRPVKTYSSGMFVRLAFAVAINMKPDILIIDEALAVGDVRFQRKCFRRLEQLKEQGVSILFVTHATESVLQYCDRAIMLDEGELLAVGNPKEVVQTYLERMFATEDTSVADASALQTTKSYAVDFDPKLDHCPKQASYNENEHRWGDARAKICHYRLLCEGVESNGLIDSGNSVTLQMSVLFECDIDDLIYGITVKTADGNAVYGTNSRLLGGVQTRQQAGDLITIEFNLHMPLLSGDYFISLGVAQDHDDLDNIAIDRRYDMVHIHVNEFEQAFGYANLSGTLSQVSQ